jgi:hypothetical protein
VGSGGAINVGEEPAADIGDSGCRHECPQPSQDRLFMESELLDVGGMADEHVEDATANVSGL